MPQPGPTEELAPLTIAIDGPAGSGKSTISRLLARLLGVPYVDTGAIYRAITHEALEHGFDLGAGLLLAQLAETLHLQLGLDEAGTTVRVDGRDLSLDIRTERISSATPTVAEHPEVRATVLRLQRGLVREHGGVMEGRDIATEVLPAAPCRFYITASAEVRAARRCDDERARGRTPDPAEVLMKICARDHHDASRAVSPMRYDPRVYHHRLDTSLLSVDQAVDVLLAHVRTLTGVSAVESRQPIDSYRGAIASA